MVVAHRDITAGVGPRGIFRVDVGIFFFRRRPEGDTESCRGRHNNGVSCLTEPSALRCTGKPSGSVTEKLEENRKTHMQNPGSTLCFAICETVIFRRGLFRFVNTCQYRQ